MKNSYKAALLAATGVVSLTASSAAAQTSPSGPEARTTAEPSAASPVASGSDAIVVTARRRVERLQDVPVAADVVSSQELRLYDLTQVQNVKIVVPQISLDRGFTGSGTSITMRGVSSSSLDAGVEQSVLLEFDGMATSRGRILNDGLFDIASIEVLKGPQALFFGKNSPGGVVSVKSADPTRELSGYLRAGYEFNSDAVSAEGAVSGPLSEQLGARLALYSSQSKGYIRNLNNGVPDLLRSAATGSTFVPAAPSRLGAEEKLGARVTLKYAQGPLDANFKLLLSRYRGQGLQSFSEVMSCPASRARPGTSGGLLDPTGDCKLDDRSSQGWLSPTIIALWPQVNRYNNGQPFSKNDSVLPTLTLNYDMGAVTLTSVSGYYDYDYVSQGNADATSYSQFWSYSNEDFSGFYQELRAVSTLDGPLNFAAGGHYEDNDRTLFVGGANNPNLPDVKTGRFHTYDNEQNNKLTAYSLFAQVMFEITPKLEFAGGGRYSKQTNKLDTVYSYVNSNSQAGFPDVGVRLQGTKKSDNFSPEATLTWKPNRNLMVYGAYKTGYLAGGFSNPGLVSRVATIKTLSFDEQKVKGVEAGIKGSMLNGALNATLTAFRYNYKGLPLTSLLVLPNGSPVFVTQNAASTRTEGLEFESTYRPARGTTLRSSASYNKARFSDFAGAQCYAGQTTGCTTNAAGARVQNLTGAPVYRAPKWILTAGAVQDVIVSSGFRASLNADVRYSSGYFSSLSLNPLSYQGSFTLLNAGAKVSTEDDRFSIALIGRNLTNRRYATLGVDKPGGAGEVFTVAGEPRAVVLQLETKF